MFERGLAATCHRARCLSARRDDYHTLLNSLYKGAAPSMMSPILGREYTETQHRNTGDLST